MWTDYWQQKKKEGCSLMEMWKTLLGFAHFHRHGHHEPKTTKPDRSLATKTGHFHLLPTQKKKEASRFIFTVPAVPSLKAARPRAALEVER
jgi:hypothetical protein